MVEKEERPEEHELPGEIDQFSAITLDTSAVSRFAYAFEKGLLRQMAQFKTGGVRFVVSNVVLDEIREHLVARGERALQAITSSVNELHADKLIADADKTVVLAPTIDCDIKALVEQRLQAFLNATGAEVIPASLADAGEVMSLYAQQKPPFGSGKKKAEFPDAIALLSLATWARSKGVRLIAVSLDKDWHNFGKERPDRMAVTSDLGRALERLQSHVPHALAQIIDLLTNRQDVIEKIRHAAIDGLSAEVPDAEASSSLHYEIEDPEFDVIDAIINLENAQNDITIVWADGNEIVARVPLTVTANAHAIISLMIWDSIDKDYFPLGSQVVEQGVGVEAAVLLTVARDPDSGEIGTIESAEFIDPDTTVDFGTIEPDFGEQPDEEEDLRHF